MEIEFERSLCVELYAEYRDLGRFMLRNKGHTIAAGLIEEVSEERPASMPEQGSELVPSDFQWVQLKQEIPVLG